MENYCIKCTPQRFVVMAKYHSHRGYILYWSETAKLTWFNLLSRHVWCILTASIQWWITLIKVIFWCLQSKVGGHASTRGKWLHIVNFSGIHCILLFIQIYLIILHLYFRTIARIVFIWFWFVFVPVLQDCQRLVGFILLFCKTSLLEYIEAMSSLSFHVGNAFPG